MYRALKNVIFLDTIAWSYSTQLPPPILRPLVEVTAPTGSACFAYTDLDISAKQERALYSVRTSKESKSPEEPPSMTHHRIMYQL